MSTSTAWLVIVTIGAGTLGLRFVPAAVLAALVVPALVYADGALALSFSNTRLVAGVLAAVVAWTTRSVLWTIGSGMAALWTLNALL